MDKPILILGAGPAGLGAALECIRFGIPAILIEKKSNTSWHPKTRNFNTRTMEIAKGWGDSVYSKLRSIDMPEGWKSPIRFLESLVGKEYGTIVSKGFEGPGPSISHVDPVLSSQDLIEKVLFEEVSKSDLVDIRFSSEALRLLTGGHEGDEEVLLEIKDLGTDSIYQLEGKVLIAADGVNSLIRTELNLKLEGVQDLHFFVNTYFTAPLEQYVGDRKGILLFVANDKVNGVLQPLDAKGKWLCQSNVPKKDWTSELYTPEKVKAWITDAVGVESLDIDIKSIGFWKLGATVVEKMVHGRVVMIGDAAHQFPPAGGLGVNTGVQGLHNVMWKVVSFCNGLSPWSLVETYDAERRMVTKAIVTQSLMNTANVFRLYESVMAGEESTLLSEDALKSTRRYGNHLGVEFGAYYQSTAIIVDGSSPPTVDDEYSDYIPSALPGCRMPHFWLDQTEEGLSSFDLIGTGFLLITKQANQSPDELENISKKINSPVVWHQITAQDIGNQITDFDELFGLPDEGAVLVRPDGYICWRTETAFSIKEIENVLSIILHMPMQHA